MSDKKTLATPRNMRAAAVKHGKRVRAFDPSNGSLAGISVNAGDYFTLGDDESLKNSDGDELLLIVEHNTSVLLDALTGRAITDDEGGETVKRVAIVLPADVESINDTQRAFGPRSQNLSALIANSEFIEIDWPVVSA